MGVKATESQTVCHRCGKKCRGRAGNPEARVFKHAKTGTCVECTAVLFLKDLDHVHGDKLFARGKECLMAPQFQELFGHMMRVGKADAAPEELDWSRVIALWDIADDKKPKGLI